MKTILLGLFLAASAFAGNPRIDRIVTAPDVIGGIKAFEASNKVDCMAPKEHQIHWMCTMSSCGFQIEVPCVSQVDTLSSNDVVYKLSFFGTESKDGVKFDSNFFTAYKFKKLEFESEKKL